MKKFFFLLLAFAFLSGASCANNVFSADQSQSANEAGLTSLDFSVIDQGSISGLTEEKNYVIKTENAWQSFWEELNKKSLAVPPLPVVDFNREMVLAVALGQKNTGGYGITIESVRESADGVSVISKITNPSGGVVTQAMSQPYCIIKLNKINKNVKFNNY